jgi:hypothetical protein
MYALLLLSFRTNAGVGKRPIDNPCWAADEVKAVAAMATTKVV